MKITDGLFHRPKKLKPVRYKAAVEAITSGWKARPSADKKLVGIDVFLDWRKGAPDQLAAALQSIANDQLSLSMITNRGVKVWPGGVLGSPCVAGGK